MPFTKEEYAIARAEDEKLAPAIDKMRLIMKQRDEGLLTNKDVLLSMWQLVYSVEV